MQGLKPRCKIGPPDIRTGVGIEHGCCRLSERWFTNEGAEYRKQWPTAVVPLPQTCERATDRRRGREAIEPVEALKGQPPSRAGSLPQYILIEYHVGNVYRSRIRSRLEQHAE